MKMIIAVITLLYVMEFYLLIEMKNTSIDSNTIDTYSSIDFMIKYNWMIHYLIQLIFAEIDVNSILNNYEFCLDENQTYYLNSSDGDW